jgi:hypothetical protein
VNGNPAEKLVDLGPNTISKLTVNSRVAVWSDSKSRYLEGNVRLLSKKDEGRFLVRYYAGEGEEWVDCRNRKVKVIEFRERKTHVVKEGDTQMSSDLSKIRVGSRVALWWAGDSAYYPGTVTRAGANNTSYYLEYDDGEKEWVDFRRHSFRLLSENGRKASNSKRRPREASEDEKMSDSEDDDEGTDEGEEESEVDDFVYGQVDGLRIGSRLSIWWSLEKKYFRGTVAKIEKSRKERARTPYFIKYDDGDEEWTDLKRRYFRILEQQRG